VNFPSALGSTALEALGSIPPFLAILFLVVLVHELGHYAVGRWCGIRVLTFSMGLGPQIVARTDRSGTTWRLALIPLGGYVKFFGDRSGASTPDHDLLSGMSPAERAVSFQHQPVWKRALTVAAGPAANTLLALGLFAAVFAVWGQDIVRPRIAAVLPGSAAERAGLQPGDVVQSVGNVPVRSFSDLQRQVSGAAGETLSVSVDRAGQPVLLSVTPAIQEIKTESGVQRLAILGVQASSAPQDRVTLRLTPWDAVGAAWGETWFVASRTASYVVGLLRGREAPDQLSGPIHMAQMSGEVVQQGLASFLRLAAVISLSIGIMNMLPIPLLDGGHLLFYALEAIRGRRLSAPIQDLSFRFGLAVVCFLIVFTTVNDIVRLTHS
jgi:regulator of sigma E protease